MEGDRPFRSGDRLLPSGAREGRSGVRVGHSGARVAVGEARQLRLGARMAHLAAKRVLVVGRRALKAGTKVFHPRVTSVLSGTKVVPLGLGLARRWARKGAVTVRPEGVDDRWGAGWLGKGAGGRRCAESGCGVHIAGLERNAGLLTLCPRPTAHQHMGLASMHSPRRNLRRTRGKGIRGQPFQRSSLWFGFLSIISRVVTAAYPGNRTSLILAWKHKVWARPGMCTACRGGANQRQRSLNMLPLIVALNHPMPPVIRRARSRWRRSHPLVPFPVH